MTETPEHRTLPRGTVGEQLGSIKWHLLPEDIRNDPNAQWVLSYDDLDRRFEFSEPIEVG